MKPYHLKGPYIGVVARDAASERRLLRTSDRAIRIQVQELWTHLHGETPPAVVLIAAEAIELHVVAALQRAHAAGVLPPIVFCCSVPDPLQMSNVWMTRISDARLVFGDETLPTLLRTLLTRPATGSYVGARLQDLFRTEDPTVRRLLERMAEDPSWLEHKIGHLAASEGLSRTRLYSLFAQSKLPSPEKVQLLFSLDAAFQATLRAASPQHAARSGGYSSVRSLRAGLARIGVSLRDMRRARRREWVFSKWVASISDPADMVA